MRELSAKQKLDVLREAKKVLGPNGRNWTMGKWFGKKSGGRNERGACVSDITRPEDANCWCLLGALEEAAYRTGIYTQRREVTRLGAMTSLKKLIPSFSRKHYGHGLEEVHTFNDFSQTRWEHVKELLDERIAQLKEELAK